MPACPTGRAARGGPHPGAGPERDRGDNPIMDAGVVGIGAQPEVAGPGRPPRVTGWGLRAVTAADVEAIADLRAEVMRADLERLGRYDGHRVRQRFRDSCSPRYTSVVTVGGELAGCVTLRPPRTAGSGWSTSTWPRSTRAGDSVPPSCASCWSGPTGRARPWSCTSSRAAPPAGSTNATASPWRPRTRSTSSFSARRGRAAARSAAARRGTAVRARPSTCGAV